MSCSSCGTKGDAAPSGCKSNGNCGTSGCNALNVYDWFKDMDLPDDFERFNIVEIRYKGSRKEYYRNISNLELYNGDYVLTEGAFGFDIGTVSATGEIVRLQLKKLRIPEQSEGIKDLIRKANDKEMERYHDLKAKENSTLERARTISFDLNLAMKISDIEFQGDGRKVTFFYTAEQRVDFRELIRRYADEFKVKIEMRHISYREEASRLGGIGDCGRQLCCSTWLTDYKQVNTGAARIQNLSINMEKLAGQCGRLKCCLNYELDTYMEVMEEFPKGKVIKLDTVGGFAIGRKSDILKKLMWFSYEGSQTWVALPVAKVNEIIEQNKQGIQAAALADLAPASQVMEKIAGGGEMEIITNDELLKEDKEFEEELRRQRQQHNQQKGGKKGHFDRRGQDNRGRNDRGGNAQNQPQKPKQNPQNRDQQQHKGPRPNNPGNQGNQGPQNRNPKGPNPHQQHPNKPRQPHQQHRRPKPPGNDGGNKGN